MKRIILLGGLMLLSGCAQLIGIKSYESGPQGTKVAFTSGIGFGAQVNQYDTVDDRKAIRPSEYSSAKAVEAKY